MKIMTWCLALLAPMAPSLEAADLDKERAAVEKADLEMAAALGARDVERFKAMIHPDGAFLGAGVARGSGEYFVIWKKDGEDWRAVASSVSPPR